jgi:hypothetical protein
MGIGLSDDWLLGFGTGLSYGYHADDGSTYATNSHSMNLFSLQYGEGETVGCGFEARHNRVYFTKEGRKRGMIPHK